MVSTSHKFQVLLDVKQQRITEEHAAELLKTSIKRVRQMVTIWSPKLAKLVPAIDALLRPANSKEQQTACKARVARIAKVTPRQVNRLIDYAEIVIPKPESVIIRKENHKNAIKMRELRKKCAIDVIAGVNSVENAAEQAEITTRQMYRIVHKLCGLNHVHYKDVKPLKDSQRRKIAADIEKLVENNKKDNDNEHTTPTGGRRKR